LGLLRAPMTARAVFSARGFCASCQVTHNWSGSSRCEWAGERGAKKDPRLGVLCGWMDGYAKSMMVEDIMNNMSPPPSPRLDERIFSKGGRWMYMYL